MDVGTKWVGKGIPLLVRGCGTVRKLGKAKDSPAISNKAPEKNGIYLGSCSVLYARTFRRESSH
ncbi:hypothetical protein [Candidatus Sororendozoicomonas aggregata]|uniref:hypothetical protein n=1 Tax=Candidatus Sororendozoicomonas aggregata TaxID=3073239 RepID=UPI002ED3F8A3